METMSGFAGVAAGLGAFGFWMFIAAIVVAGMWYDIRKREAQQETLRRIVESGQPVDETMIDKLTSASTGGGRGLERELRVYGLVTLFIAPGLAVLGWFLSLQYQPALYPVLGVSVLVLFIAVGLLVAAGVAGRDRQADDTIAVGRTG